MKRHFRDLTNQEFGRLTALFPLDIRAKNGEILWQCSCICGGSKIVKASHLIYNNTRSCGCIRTKSLAGLKFGKLTAIKPIKQDNGVIVWECKCDCGQTRNVLPANLFSGLITSCGCNGTKRNKLRRVDENFNKTKTGKITPIKVGQKFGRLTILEDSGKRFYDYIIWKCQCTCGNITYAPSLNLLNNKVKSCGCLHKEQQLKYQQSITKHNRYKFNQIGIGYDDKNHKFWFDKSDYDKIKDLYWKTEKDGYQFRAFDKKNFAATGKNSNIALWRVVLDDYEPNHQIVFKNGNRSDYRKNNLEVIV